MNIIIPAAGKSLRFKSAGYKLPKCFLPVGDKMMIENIFEIFDYKDTFYLIFPSSFKKKYFKKINYLKKNYKNLFIVFIKDHSSGPVFSILNNVKINTKEEVIITYCDFIVEWNYQLFKRQIYGYDGGVPCFKGFHPASFGKTFYAYIKKDLNNILLKIKEKKSFTKNRNNEPASTGIYYFKSLEVFNYYAKKLINNKKYINGEAYVSLIYNLMSKDGLKNLVTFVDKFICFGTPEDYKHYKHLENYFNRKIKKRIKFKQTNIIPMAGYGKRFKIENYNIIKPFIPIRKSPMIIRSCKSFPEPRDWIFIAKKQDFKNLAAENLIKNNFKNSKIIKINKKTNGQAETCLLVKNIINKELPLFIASCDYETIYSDYKLNKIILDKSIDGIIWTFKLKNILVKNYNSFAYCKVNKSNKILSIIEKKTISKYPQEDQMVVGSFWFRKAEDFIESAEKLIKNNEKINDEYYVGNSIKYLIKQKKRKFIAFEINNWISFGNPFELSIFSYWDEYFHNQY